MEIWLRQPWVKGFHIHPVWLVRYEEPVDLPAMIRRIVRILNRLLQSVVTLLGVSLLVFLITHAIPADPVAAVAGPQADEETRERIRQELGLNDPLWEQYGRYLWDVLHGDLGKSFVTGERVHRRHPDPLPQHAGSVAGRRGDLADRRRAARRADGEVPRQAH